MQNFELKIEELEVAEEMMSDFEKGFWEGIGIVGAGTILVSVGVAILT